MKTKKCFIYVCTFIVAVTLFTGCTDTTIGTEKNGPADAFLNRFNDDSDTQKDTYYPLSVRTNHADRGTVTITPRPSEDSLYIAGTQVTLEAQAIFPYVFTEWTGIHTGEGNATNSTVTITMNENRIITANFQLHPLIHGENEAWTLQNTSGFILNADGTFHHIIFQNNVWACDMDMGGGQWRPEIENGEGILYLNELKYTYTIIGNGQSLMLAMPPLFNNAYIKAIVGTNLSGGCR